MTRISTSTTPISKTERGFTIIEILVVVALMALVFAAALPGITGTMRVSIESSSRDLATTIRATFDEASLKGRVYRVVFDIDKGQYWVEQGPVQFSLTSEELKREEAEHEARLTKEERDARPHAVFGLATAVTRDKKSLPLGIKFTDVIGSQTHDPIKGGTAYAHVFPHGFIEKTTIHLKDGGGHETTLFVDSVSGKSRIINSYVKEGAQ